MPTIPRYVGHSLQLSMVLLEFRFFYTFFSKWYEDHCVSERLQWEKTHNVFNSAGSEQFVISYSSKISLTGECLMVFLHQKGEPGLWDQFTCVWIFTLYLTTLSFRIFPLHGIVKIPLLHEWFKPRKAQCLHRLRLPSARRDLPSCL